MADVHIELLTGQEREKGAVRAAPAATGLTITTAVLFITGEMTGSGVLALPAAVAQSSWFGIFIICFCALVSAFTGTVLGRCWIMLITNVKGVNSHCQDPYPTIGFHAFGSIGKWIVDFSVYFTLFGVCVVLLLLSSQNIQSLLQEVQIKFSFCYMVIIIGAILAPFCWLKSPKDFWPIALMATVTTAAACLLIVIQSIMDMGKVDDDISSTIPPLRNETDNSTQVMTVEKEETAVENKITFQGFFLAFGMILFCFGGMAAFPTIQADMKEPTKFPTTVVIAMIAILLMYIPVGSVAYAVYGTDVKQNVFESLSPGLLVAMARILITVHLISAYVILQNPLSQFLEHALHIKNEFSWKRALLRTLITIVVVFTALSCPKFGNILSLVGGSSVTLNTFVFPSVFYFRLCQKHGSKWQNAKVKNWEMPIHIIIILIGIAGGISSTYSALTNIMDPKAFVLPCYLDTNVVANSSGVH